MSSLRTYCQNSISKRNNVDQQGIDHGNNGKSSSNKEVCHRFLLHRYCSNAFVIQKYPAYPATCPACDDDFPKDPTEKIKAIYSKLQQCLRNRSLPRLKDGEPKGSNFIRLELCVAIQAE